MILAIAGFTSAAVGAQLPATTSMNAEIAWGETVNGLRLHVMTDRDTYRLGADLVNVAFVIQNTTNRTYPITLAVTAEMRVDLSITDATGAEYFVPGSRGERLATETWKADLLPGKIARVNALFDPATWGPGLQPGTYRLRGTFRYSGPHMAPWIADDFALESNEVSLALTGWNATMERPWPEGDAAGGASLTLLAERRTWSPGDPPIPFTILFNRLDDGPDSFPPLSVYGLTYYHLEVTSPSGDRFVVPQPVALPSSISPHFRFAAISQGRSVGERLLWDPDGALVDRTATLNELILASGPAASEPGTYEIRAVYQVDVQVEAKFAYGIGPARLVSNPIEIEIEGVR